MNTYTVSFHVILLFRVALMINWTSVAGFIFKLLCSFVLLKTMRCYASLCFFRNSSYAHRRDLQAQGDLSHCIRWIGVIAKANLIKYLGVWMNFSSICKAILIWNTIAFIETHCCLFYSKRKSEIVSVWIVEQRSYSRFRISGIILAVI